MKNHKFLKGLISIMLVLIMALLVPAQALAASNNDKYVSEVYVAYGKNEDEAKKTLEDMGYIAAKGNLNEGGDTYAMLGYKTTNDIRESITDLAVMNMNGGYSVEDYKTFLNSQKAQIAEFLNEFMAVIGEYRENLKNNKTRAVVAHDILNNYIDDDTKMKMGDLLNSETLQDRVGINKSVNAENPDNLPDLLTILLQGNAQVINSIETLLSLATDANENTWIDRFAQLDYDTLLDNLEDERPDLNTQSKQQQYLDNLYEVDALAVGGAMTKLRAKLQEYEAILEKANKPEDVWSSFFSSMKKQSAADYQAMLESEEWLSIGMIYGNLKEYEGGNFAKGELLEYLMEDVDEDDTEFYYPMIAALSDGQRYALPFIDLQSLFCYAFTDEEGWTKVAEEWKSKFGSPEDISVYALIDRDVYKEDGSVALTDSAQRANTVNNVGSEGSESEQMNILARITQISWAATGISLAATAVSAGFAKYLKYDVGSVDVFSPNGTIIGSRYDDAVVNAIEDPQAYQAFKATQANATKVAYVGYARFAYVLTRVLLVTTIVLAVITTVLTVIDALQDKSVEQLPIPKYMVDNHTDTDGSSYTLYYKAVECNRESYFGSDYTKQTGSSADVNADEGKQWLALYASKNSKAGNGRPIKPNFRFADNTGYMQDRDAFEGGIHLFGEKGVVNLADSKYMNYSTLSNIYQTVTSSYKAFMYYQLSNDVKTYDEASGNMTASALRSSTTAIFGFGGLAIGAIVGAVGAVLVSRGKKKKENA